MKAHVAVLMGGLSAEREVSLVSGEACSQALEQHGYRVSRIDPKDGLITELQRARPDAVFNALHGRFGEDGRVQGLLDLMRLPYSHSGVLASSVAMNKPLAARLFNSIGLKCPEHSLATLPEILESPPMDSPFVVKPVAEGSSVGVTLILDDDLEPLRARNDWSHDDHLMVEKYIPGRELTCGVLNGKPLAVTEITSSEGFYDYRAKYTEGGSVHVLPAVLPDEISGQVMEMAAGAHALLGCRGASRCDFRFDEQAGIGGVYLLELNTQPGMTPLSLLPEQADFCGIPFESLVLELMEAATCDA